MGGSGKLVRLRLRTPDSSAGIVSVVVVRDRLVSEPTATVVVVVSIVVVVAAAAGGPHDAVDVVDVVETIVMDMVGSTAALPVIFDITDGESIPQHQNKKMKPIPNRFHAISYNFKSNFISILS